MLAVDAVQKAKSEHPGTPMDAAPAARRCGSACRDMTRRTPVGSIATASCCPGCTPPSQERCAPERETYDAPELETYELIRIRTGILTLWINHLARYRSVQPPRECLFPGCYRCSRRVAAKHSPPQLGLLETLGFRAVLRIRLGVSTPERSGNSLSGRRSLSGAWESTDLLYKLFHQHFQ